MKRETGTRQDGWGKHPGNCILGCSHECKYCYARAKAMRFKEISKPEQWGVEVVNVAAFDKIHKYRDGGRVMFPTAHDISPDMLNYCIEYMRRQLDAGNTLLIVSKPHFPCVETLVEEFADFKTHIEFRFSLGAMSNSVLNYWEPHAPDFDERVASLIIAHRAGFETSASLEPLLEPWKARELCAEIAPLVSTIWVGKLREIGRRVIVKNETDARAVRILKEWQTDAAVMGVVKSLKDCDKVRWKDSYQEVIDRHTGEEVRK